ncbi:MAG: cold-shock protein [Bacillota bacterium]
MFTGKIKMYNPAKGYGFIIRPDGEDLFFHISGCHIPEAELKPGLPVVFEETVDNRSKRTRAVDVEKAEV